MRMTLLAAAAALFAAGAAHATTVSDPVGDVLPTFVGTAFPDLDITSFSVDLNPSQTAFDFSATLDGNFDPTHTSLYVIGVDTGAGAIRPFANIGEPAVIFDQAIVVVNNGAALLGSNSLSATLSGDMFSVSVPVSMLPSTGFTPGNYRFNLWARNGLGNNNQNADFAPQNATITATAVPEPATWALMIFGFGLAGATVRGRRVVKTA